MILIYLLRAAQQVGEGIQNIPAGQANCTVGTDNATCNPGLPVATANASEVHNVLQIVFGTMAALAVLIIVIAGLRFVTAQGDPQEVAKARNTIVYALVGLVVALIAEAIVSLLLGNL